MYLYCIYAIIVKDNLKISTFDLNYIYAIIILCKLSTKLPTYTTIQYQITIKCAFKIPTSMQLLIYKQLASNKHTSYVPASDQIYIHA